MATVEDAKTSSNPQITGVQTQEMSAYERSREERIKANLERMQKLGIADLSLKLKSLTSPPKRTKRPFTKRDSPLPAFPPSESRRRSSRLQNAVMAKKSGPVEDEYAMLDEGTKPEVYTKEHEKLLGSTEKSWTLFVDGYGKDGKRICDPIKGKTCHQCRTIKARGTHTLKNFGSKIATGSYCHLIAANSLSGKRLNLIEDSFLTLNPVAGKDQLPHPPFPLISDRELLLHRKTFAFKSSKKTIVFPRFYGDWVKLIDKLSPKYQTAWEEMGISNFIRLTRYEMRISESVLEGALNFWSTHCNSLVLPLGPMSITLRDVVALTGLPIFGEEVPSRIKTDAFSELKVMTVQKAGTYYSMISKKLALEELTDEDHVHFLWLLLCNFIFEPLGGRPTPDVFMIAKALASGQKLALGTMLLANTYHRLAMTVTDQPFTRPRGGLWLLQLWIFAYFPHLATEQLEVSTGCIGVDLCHSYSSLDLGEVVRYFRTLVPTSLNDLFLFNKRDDSFLPKCAYSYFSVNSQEGSHWWNLFCMTRHLHHGISPNRNSRAPSPGLVLYAPCLWSRQLGFYQAIPGPLPFLSLGQQNNANEEEIEQAVQEARQDRGPIVLEAGQPSFNAWWELVFNHCVPLDSSGSSSKELNLPKPKKVKLTEIAQGKTPQFNCDTRSYGRDHRLGLGFNNTPADPINMTETDDSNPREKVNVALPEREEFEVNVSEISKDETEPSEDPYLDFDDEEDVIEDRIPVPSSTTDHPASSSEFSSFDFGSISQDIPLMQPPAREVLPSSSSFDILISTPLSQESSLTNTRLEPVSMKIDNSFASLDFSFTTGLASPFSASGSDRIKAAQAVVVELIAAPLSTWTPDQVGRALKSFDVLDAASTDAVKAGALRGIKVNVVQAYNAYGMENDRSSTLSARVKSHIAELDSYKQKFDMIVGAKEPDEKKLEEIRVKANRIQELKRELATVRADHDALLRSGSEFRPSLPKMESELQREKERLANHYDEIRDWHRESEEHRQAAMRLCTEWSKKSQPLRDNLTLWTYQSQRKLI